MPVPFLFDVNRCRTGGTKKTPPSAHGEARKEPIWFLSGEVNRVRRFGAFTRVQSKKLPWVGAIAAELTECLPAKVTAHNGLSYPGKAKLDGALPSFASYLTRRGLSGGQKPATRSVWTSHPMKWSWSLTALPRFGQPSLRRMAGEVIEQGRMRSGAGREAQKISVAPRISGKRSYARDTRCIGCTNSSCRRNGCQGGK